MSKNIHKILLPVDFKEASVKALIYVSGYAASTNADLILLYVIDTPGLLAQFFKSNDYLVKITDQAKEELLRLAELAKKKAPDLHISTRIEMGKPYQKILEVSASTKAQMIILGSNHGGFDTDDELGTTVFHVTLKSPVPVLTYKGSDKIFSNKIVVPLDLTKDTRKQLTAALFFG